jgi:tetratricopeptide (TPR) repeat protein
MQDAVAEDAGSELALTLRIGITTGDVLVGASTVGGDYTAMGDTMNLASRLEQIAAPGQIMVGPATEAASREAIIYRPVGEVPTKGRSGLVRIFEAVRAVGVPGARRLPHRPLIGRSHELGLLDALGKLAVEARRAQLAVLQGEAGVGKNRIAYEAAELQRERRGALVVQGRCAPYGEANVWWPIAEALRDALQISGDVPVDEARTGIEHWLTEREVECDPGRIIPALLHTLGYQTPLRGGDRERNRAEVYLAVSTLLGSQLSRTPIVFVMSDADWASDAVWGLLERLLNGHADQPLFVIITSRDAALPEGLRSGDFGSLTFEVQPLDPAATAELIPHLGVSLSERNAARLVERSGGNPFFLEELVALIERRSAEGAGLTADDIVDQLMTAEVQQLPDTLRGTIAARLDGLDTGCRLLLDEAAVLGRAGPTEGLSRMAKEARGVDDISDDLNQLIDEGLIEVGDGRYRFRSDLVRDVAYATITKTGRAQRHYRIADYLERQSHPSLRNSTVVAIADHYRRSAQLVNEMGSVAGLDRATVVAKAIHWVHSAGDRALKSDPPSAESWFSSGFELAADNETKALMLYGRAQAKLEVGHIQSAREDLDQLDRLMSQNPLLRAQTLLVRGNLERRSGNHSDASAMLREAADRLAALDEKAEQALALRLLGLAELERSQHDLARRALEASQRVAASINDPRSEAWAFQSLAWQAFRAGRVDEAAGFVDRARELFTSINDLGGLTWTRGVEGWVLFHNGHLRQAEAVVSEVLPETMRRGDPWAEGIIQVLNASVHLWSGRPEKALAASQHALAAAARADDVNLAVQARAVQGRAHISLANIDEGLLSLEQSYALADHQGDADSQRLAAAANCAAAARLGDPTGVLHWAGKYESVHSHPDVVGESEIIVSLALGLLQQGRVEEALRELTWADTDVPVASRVAGDAVSALIHVASGDLDRAIDRIDNVLAGEGTYLDLFRARTALAGMYFRQGRIAEAKSVYEHAVAEMTISGDRITGPIGALFAGVCQFGPLETAELRCRALGIDPTGWVLAFRSVVGFEESLRTGG